MIISIGKEKLVQLVNRQLDLLFMYSNEDTAEYIDQVLERTEKCFSASASKYYKKGDEVYFSPHHSAQYTIFLYLLANTAWNVGRNSEFSTVVYYLNKALNGVDIYYENALPEIFSLEHPVGSVMGRANYSNFLYFYQGCTVGGIQKGKTSVYPTLGEHVTLCANSSILGNCQIGDNVTLAAGAMIKNQDVPSDSVVYGISPNITIKPANKSKISELQIDKWIASK